MRFFLNFIQKNKECYECGKMYKIARLYDRVKFRREFIVNSLMAIVENFICRR